MTPKTCAKKVKEILDLYFPAPAIPLHHTDSYTLLIAVLLSGNCTDAQVNKVTPALFAQANTPEKMIQLSVPQIAALIRSCGLAPRKSQAIWDLSKILIEKYDGKVPDSFEALESLPGVGHKTASVVMSQAFNHEAFPVDTHIHRCAMRWGLSNGRSVKQTEKDLKELFNKKDWNRIHLQMIYFARAFCPARRHIPEECPICNQV